MSLINMNGNSELIMARESPGAIPDTAFEVVSIRESGDYAFAPWRLTATHPVPLGLQHRSTAKLETKL